MTHPENVLPQDWTEDDYEMQVNFITLGGIVSVWDHAEQVIFRQIMAVVNMVLGDENKQWAVWQAIRPVLTASTGVLRARLHAWLPTFYAASRADMDALYESVQLDDNYLIMNQKKLEGWFMRRYLAAGRGAGGKELLVRQRMYMALVAKELGMPEAPAWIGEVKREIQAAKAIALKSTYLTAL